MKIPIYIFLLFPAVLLFSCSPGETPEDEVSVLNAPSQYMGVMKRSMDMASSIEPEAELKHVIDLFYFYENRYPRNLDELVEEGYMEDIPQIPRSMQIIYDPGTGRVEIK